MVMYPIREQTFHPLARFLTVGGHRDFLQQVLRFSNLNRYLWCVKMGLLILAFLALPCRLHLGTDLAHHIVYKPESSISHAV